MNVLRVPKENQWEREEEEGEGTGGRERESEKEETGQERGKKGEGESWWYDAAEHQMLESIWQQAEEQTCILEAFQLPGGHRS